MALASQLVFVSGRPCRHSAVRVGGRQCSPTGLTCLRQQPRQTFLSPRLPVGSRALRIAESLKLAAFFRPNHSWRQDLRHRPPVVDTCA
jgi:hypothetical protein